MSKSPITAYLEWFDATPADVQRWIVNDVGIHAPKLFPWKGQYPVAEDVRAALLDADNNLAPGSMGTLLLVIALTNYTFYEKNSEEAFKRKREDLELQLKVAKSRNFEGMIPRINENLEKLPFEAKLWTREAQRWSQLRDSELSLDRIKQWMRAEIDVRARQAMRQIDQAREQMQPILSLFEAKDEE
jgi:hypothetical protein